MPARRTQSLEQVTTDIAAVTADTEAWKAELRASLVNQLDTEDLQAIMQAQVDKAKAGDLTAAKFVMQQIGMQTPVSIRQTTNNVITDPESAAKIARGS